MCGRFTLQTPEAQIRKAFNLPVKDMLGKDEILEFLNSALSSPD
jgi:hypothetical protein